MHIGTVRCLVTAGPTIEPLDEVRRFTNHSTGQLGCELADALTRTGHQVTLLLSETARHSPRQKTVHVIAFSTTSDLQHQLNAIQSNSIEAVFHVAAVSDYRVSCIRHTKTGSQIKARKINTEHGRISVELSPTPKIIHQLHRWYPKAKIIGWKYEVEGDRESAVAVARNQIKKCRTNACVANGPGYGEGFALVTTDAVKHSPNASDLLKQLVKFIE